MKNSIQWKRHEYESVLNFCSRVESVCFLYSIASSQGPSFRAENEDPSQGLPLAAAPSRVSIY
jgi:hypothetical protein